MTTSGSNEDNPLIKEIEKAVGFKWHEIRRICNPDNHMHTIADSEEIRKNGHAVLRLMGQVEKGDKKAAQKLLPLIQDLKIPPDIEEQYMASRAGKVLKDIGLAGQDLSLPSLREQQIVRRADKFIKEIKPKDKGHTADGEDRKR